MTHDYRQARERMIADQLRRRGIRDARVLEAFRRIPRHRFVDPALEGQAYADRALPIGHGQTISQPYMVALMTAALSPAEEDRVLEVGTGSGYQAAILACLAHSVFTIERVPALAQRAQQLFDDLQLTNIITRVGDGSRGWISYAPYQGIIVTAGAPGIPPSLLAQLADGGRLVVPTGSRQSQSLVVVTRRGARFERQEKSGCLFVPLIGKEGWRDG